VPQSSGGNFCSGTIAEILGGMKMPLHRRPGAAVVNGKDIDFAMASHIGTTVGCMVTQAALDVLATLGSLAPINPASINRLNLFLRWQKEIETIASDKYDAGLLAGGRMVIIRPHDFIRSGFIR
jgi:hypothetical protein